MSTKKTQLLSACLLSITPWLTYAAHTHAGPAAYAHGLHYDVKEKTVRINHLCNSHFSNATLSIKATKDGREERVAENFRADSSGCLNLELKNIVCDHLRIYATDSGRSGQEFAKEKCTSVLLKKQVVDLDKVRREAENKGRFYANQVAARYDGGLANYAYNYAMGLRQAESQWGGRPQQLPSYEEGSSIGRREGALIGDAQGRNDGTSTGVNMGITQVTQQYRNILRENQKGISPQWKASMDATVPAYNIGSYSAGKNTEFKDFLIGEINQSPLQSYGSLKQLVFERNLNLDHYVGDVFWKTLFAFSDFESKTEYKEQAAYYHKLTDAEYENAASARQTYVDIFTQVYSDVIKEKIAKEIQESNSRARSAGYQAAQVALSNVAYNKGYNEGYTQSAQSAAQKAFATAYTVAYDKAFKERVRYLDNNSVIEGIEAKFLDSENKEEFVIGQPVSLHILSLTNIGRKGGSLEVVLKGSLEAKEKVEVKGLSQVKNIVFKDIGKIDPSSQLGKQIIFICISGVCFDQSLELKWSNQIKGLTKQGVDSQASEDLAQFIRGVLLNEWKEIYKSNPGQYKSNYDLLKNEATATIVVPTSKLGEFEKTVKAYIKSAGKTVDISSFTQKIIRIGEDYLAMKNAMLSPDVAGRLWSMGMSPAKVKQNDGQLQEKMINKMSPEEIDIVKKDFMTQQEELARWVRSDRVMQKQMEGCWSKTRRQEVSCVGFVSEEESRVDNYRQWGLGNRFVQREIINVLKSH